MSSFALRILAMVSMLIDHVGVVFRFYMPETAYILCRTAGRIAMPVFCFLIAEGLFHTKNARRYLTRMALFAVISEIPFDMMLTAASGGGAETGFPSNLISFTSQNVGFTLLLGLLGILLYDSFAARGNKIAALASVLAAAAASILFRTDYSVFGVYYVFVFYYFRARPKPLTAAVSAGVLLLSLSSYFGNESLSIVIVSLAAAAAVIPINLYNGERGRNNAAWRFVFYLFYPVHMAGLYLLWMTV